LNIKKEGALLHVKGKHWEEFYSKGISVLLKIKRSKIAQVFVNQEEPSDAKEQKSKKHGGL